MSTICLRKMENTITTQKEKKMSKKPNNVISVPFGQPKVAEKLLELKQLRKHIQANIKKYDEIIEARKKQDDNKE